MKFACRMCRKEVAIDESGVANHIQDSSPACIVTIGGVPMPDWDRHEVVEDETSLVSDPKS